MGIGTGILNALGRSLDSQYRKECEVLARAVIAQAPIDTVKSLFGLFGRGCIIEALVMEGFSRRDAEGGEPEVEYEMGKMFNAAKADGPGSPSDQSIRSMTTAVVVAGAKGGQIVISTF